MRRPRRASRHEPFAYLNFPVEQSIWTTSVPNFQAAPLLAPKCGTAIGPRPRWRRSGTSRILRRLAQFLILCVITAALRFSMLSRPAPAPPHGFPPLISEPLVGRWCARPCDRQLMPAKRNVGLLKCDARRRHAWLPCYHAKTSARPLQRQLFKSSRFHGQRDPPFGGE